MIWNKISIVIFAPSWFWWILADGKKEICSIQPEYEKIGRKNVVHTFLLPFFSFNNLIWYTWWSMVGTLGFLGYVAPHFLWIDGLLKWRFFSLEFQLLLFFSKFLLKLYFSTVQFITFRKILKITLLHQRLSLVQNKQKEIYDEKIRMIFLFHICFIVKKGLFTTFMSY
jgi:Zn-dependent protease with chaperone function